MPEAGFGYINAIMFSFVTIIIAFVASVKRKKLLIDTPNLFSLRGNPARDMPYLLFGNEHVHQ